MQVDKFLGSSFSPLSFPKRKGRCMSVRPFLSSDLRASSSSSGVSGSRRLENVRRKFTRNPLFSATQQPTRDDPFSVPPTFSKALTFANNSVLPGTTREVPSAPVLRRGPIRLSDRIAGDRN